MSSTSKSKRTRTGCLCCRRRHKKCDEQRPSCKFCISKGIECEWPIKGSVFVTYKNDPSSNAVPGTSTMKFINSNPTSASPKSPNPIVSNSPQTTESNYTISPINSIPIPVQQTLIPATTTTNKEFNSIRLMPKSRESLPSLNQYHFVIPRDQDSSLLNPLKKSEKLGTQNHRLSVNSLLN